jgi:hypothetical protein
VNTHTHTHQGWETEGVGATKISEAMAMGNDASGVTVDVCRASLVRAQVGRGDGRKVYTVTRAISFSGPTRL